MDRTPEVVLTHHCVGRFHERFRPALDVIAARRELERLLEHGEVADSPLEWMARTMQQEADAYLIVGNDLVIPLAAGLGEHEWVAKSCIPHGGISEAARRRRNERRRARRARSRRRR